jgi:hypothetical protein
MILGLSTQKIRFRIDMEPTSKIFTDDIVKEVLMTKNGPINFAHNFFPNSPLCKDMKSVEKMACSFDSAPEINF